MHQPDLSILPTLSGLYPIYSACTFSNSVHTRARLWACGLLLNSTWWLHRYTFVRADSIDGAAACMDVCSRFWSGVCLLLMISNDDDNSALSLETFFFSKTEKDFSSCFATVDFFFPSRASLCSCLLQMYWNCCLVLLIKRQSISPEQPQ